MSDNQMNIELSEKDIIVCLAECSESSPCYHFVNCKKLNINCRMNSIEIYQLYKKYDILNKLDIHILGQYIKHEKALSS